MHELIIKYKDRKTLKVLTALGEYLGFTIADPEKKKDFYYINGIPVESGDTRINMQDLTTVFTGQDIDAKTLRKLAWQRKR